MYKFFSCHIHVVSVSDYDSWCLLNCRDTCTLYLWRSMCGLCIHVYDSMSSQTLGHRVLDVYIPPTYLSYIAPMLTRIYVTEELMPYSESSYVADLELSKTWRSGSQTCNSVLRPPGTFSESPLDSWLSPRAVYGCLWLTCNSLVYVGTLQ